MRKLNNKHGRLDLKINKNVIEHDSYDMILFNGIRKSNPTIKKTAEEGQENYEQFKELHADLFNSMYKYEPKKVPENTIDYKFLLNSEIMDNIMKSDQYKELRNLTRLDSLASTVGTEVMGEEVQKLIKELKDKFEEQLKQLEAAAQTAQQNQPQPPDPNAQPGSSDSGSGTGRDPSVELAYEEAKKKVEEHMQNIKDLVDKPVQREISKIMEKAVNSAMETSEMISNWGLDASDSFVKSGYQEKMKMLNRLRNSKKLQQIAELAGRYKRMAIQTQREKIKQGMDEVYDIVPGQDLGRILASEKMKLLNRATSMLFKKDYLEAKTLQYQTSGKEKKQKGPIVICIDDSGSMYGQSEIWAKSVALGVLEIARIQKRDLYVIHFDASPKHRLHCNHFPKNNYNIENIIDMAEYFTGGGTLFEPPLELAQDKINDMPEFSKADILFITDGESAVRDGWLRNYLKWKKEKNVGITSILIDGYSNSNSCVKTFSDTVEKLSTIRKNNSDELAINLFMSM